jgi:serine/threonine-protein kinase
MLDADDRAVVMDFGIAYAKKGTSLTQHGAVIGTPQYMSPEQCCGKELDARSDIYSLGLMLYQMAAGSLPFQASDAVSLMYMHVHKIPEPPDARNPHVPRWLRDIILTCLAKKPENRELRRAIEKWGVIERPKTPWSYAGPDYHPKFAPKNL